MRTQSPSFAYANASTEKYPRFVVGIIFDTDSLYFTSHDDIPNVPGVVTQKVVTINEARSQKIVPDQGRSEIGAVDFELLDPAVGDSQGDGEVTLLFREKLNALLGLRGRKVILYHGWAGADFTTFQIFQTQIIQSVAWSRGSYSIRCADITREQRKDIFDPKLTRLASSIDADDDEIMVANANAFEMVEHSASFSDAPLDTVGYIQIDNEIIRYTGIDSNGTTFLGCVRGVLNTRAVPHSVDLSTPQDQRTEVKEYIYLELPVPKLIYAVLTGNLSGQSPAVLPAHWHLGIDPTWVKLSDFTSIGTDLWQPSNDAASFVARFGGLKKTDGKKFLEAELYQLIGCYPLVYSDGTVGIRRMNRILFDAPFVAVLDEVNTESWSDLQHDMPSVANDYEVQWNVDQDDKPTRYTRLIDGTSIAIHGPAPRKTIKFRGLFGNRHTDSTVRARLDSLRDRYAHPPALLDLRVMPHLNVLEVGDVVRVRNSKIRDYANGGASIDRSMEVQGTRINLRTGDVDLDLFGSTGLSSTNSPDWDGTGTPPDTIPMPDSFYDSEGTELGTVVDLTQVGDVWETDPGVYALTGDADPTLEASIYYHLGDLTISSDTILTLSENVQLRVMGFLTINGELNGVASGLQGVDDTTDYGTSTIGIPAFGTVRAMSGVALLPNTRPTTWANVQANTTVGTFDQVPYYDLVIIDGSQPILQGLPNELRGTSGGPGGKVLRNRFGNRVVDSLGGSGGAGGAGLIIISRGLTLGVSATIDLSGGDTLPTTPVNPDSTSEDVLAGAGAPGAPGALLIVLDGTDLSVPDLTGGRFLAITGASGAPRVNTMSTPSGGSRPWSLDTGDEPGEGFLDPATTHLQDMSNAAYRIQYLADIGNPLEDQPTGVPAPDNLTATGVPNGILVEWDSPDFDLISGVEVYASATNDRSVATKITEVLATSYLHPLAPGTTRFYWIRNRRQASRSIWEPVSPTAGVSATST